MRRRSPAAARRQPPRTGLRPPFSQLSIHPRARVRLRGRRRARRRPRSLYLHCFILQTSNFDPRVLLPSRFCLLDKAQAQLGASSTSRSSSRYSCSHTQTQTPARTQQRAGKPKTHHMRHGGRRAAKASLIPHSHTRHALAHTIHDFHIAQGAAGTCPRTSRMRAELRCGLDQHNTQ